MATTSPKLGLTLPATVDPFSTATIKQNWEKIDTSPGAYICTSSTRPVWTAAQTGRTIFETDTDLHWVWKSNTWKRMSAVGLLKTSTGDWAIKERTEDFQTTSTTYVRCVTLTGVVIPSGNRPIRVDVSWQKAINKDGNFWGAIFRSSTADSGPKMAQWNFGTTGDDKNAGGGVYWGIERSGLAAGTYDFSFQIKANVGQSKITAGNLTPAILMVTEL